MDELGKTVLSMMTDRGVFIPETIHIKTFLSYLHLRLNSIMDSLGFRMDHLIGLPNFKAEDRQSP
jgi:hypothetical protein